MKQVKGMSYQVNSIAPATFQELKANSTGILTVWDGASDNTIYGDANVNHAFRAWHDALHLKLNASFTLEGEILVAKEQSRLIGSDLLGDILIAEVKGQAEYFNKHGQFPVNQVEFITNYLKGQKV